MPKIRQALAVLAAAASCIAFNTYRYPVVREMVAAISSPSQAKDLKPSEKPGSAFTEHKQAPPAAFQTSNLRGSADCKNGICSMPSVNSFGTGLNRSSATEQPGYNPRHVEAASEFSLGAKSDDSQTLTATSSDANRASKSKAFGTEPPQGAKSLSWPKSLGSSRDAGESDTVNTRSAESEDSADLLKSGSRASADTARSTQEFSVSKAALAAKEATSSYDPYAVQEFGAGYEAPSPESAIGKGLKSGSQQQKSEDFQRSAPSGISTDSFQRDKQAPTAAPLVPIARPAGRNHRPADAADKAMAGFQFIGQLGTKSSQVRHLPPVGSEPSAEPVSLSPDLARTYPITSAE